MLSLLYFISVAPLVIYIFSFVRSTGGLESVRSGQDSRKAGAGTATADHGPFDVRVQRSGTGYNVSWTTHGSEKRVKRYVVKWYDAVDGKELGSASSAANDRNIGECSVPLII